MHLIEDGNTLCRFLKESILCLLFIIVRFYSHTQTHPLCFKTMKVVCSQSAKIAVETMHCFAQIFIYALFASVGRRGGM